MLFKLSGLLNETASLWCDVYIYFVLFLYNNSVYITLSIKGKLMIWQLWKLLVYGAKSVECMYYISMGTVLDF